MPYRVNQIILRKDTWLRAFRPWYYVNRTIYNIHFFFWLSYVRTPMTAARHCWSQFIAGAYRWGEERDERKRKKARAAIADLASFECQVMEFVFTWKKKHPLRKKKNISLLLYRAFSCTYIKYSWDIEFRLWLTRRWKRITRSAAANTEYKQAKSLGAAKSSTKDVYKYVSLKSFRVYIFYPLPFYIYAYIVQYFIFFSATYTYV